jgi:hypothetical protein
MGFMTKSQVIWSGTVYLATNSDIPMSSSTTFYFSHKMFHSDTSFKLLHIFLSTLYITLFELVCIYKQILIGMLTSLWNDP